MKPQVNNKEIKNPRYKFAWYKSFVRLLKNQRCPDFKNPRTICNS
jgi:hypothetical protein